MQLPEFVDERFLTHRLRATSLAGIICAVLALMLCLYRYFTRGVVDRDLLALGAAFIVLKYALLFYYRATD